MIPAEMDDVCFAGLMPGFQGDEGAGCFTPLLVGPGHHCRFQDIGMAVERTFHLDGGDVFATGDDDVLEPVLDLEIAIGMPYAQVAGVKPAAFESLSGR